LKLLAKSVLLSWLNRLSSRLLRMSLLRYLTRSVLSVLSKPCYAPRGHLYLLIIQVLRAHCIFEAYLSYVRRFLTPIGRGDQVSWEKRMMRRRKELADSCDIRPKDIRHWLYQKEETFSQHPLLGPTSPSPASFPTTFRELA